MMCKMITVQSRTVFPDPYVQNAVVAITYTQQLQKLDSLSNIRWNILIRFRFWTLKYKFQTIVFYFVASFVAEQLICISPR